MESFFVNIIGAVVPVAVGGAIGIWGARSGQRMAADETRRQLERTHELELERMKYRGAASYLEEQLRCLYGPLYFFIVQNEELLRLYGQIHSEYGKFFKGSWSPEPGTQEALGEEMTATLELGNEYVRRVAENNVRVMDILERNWHLADPVDIDVFASFQVDHVRLRMEATEDRRKKVPLPILLALGDIFGLFSKACG